MPSPRPQPNLTTLASRRQSHEQLKQHSQAAMLSRVIALTLTATLDQKLTQRPSWISNNRPSPQLSNLLSLLRDPRIGMGGQIALLRMVGVNPQTLLRNPGALNHPRVQRAFQQLEQLLMNAEQQLSQQRKPSNVPNPQAHPLSDETLRNYLQSDAANNNILFRQALDISAGIIQAMVIQDAAIEAEQDLEMDNKKQDEDVAQDNALYYQTEKLEDTEEDNQRLNLMENAIKLDIKNIHDEKQEDRFENIVKFLGSNVESEKIETLVQRIEKEEARVEQKFEATLTRAGS